MNVGDTFLDAGTAGTPKHLWIVVAISNGQVLAFNLSTCRDGCDTSCTLEPREHPFVHDRSFAYYQRGLTWQQESLQTLLDDGFFIPKPPVGAAILRRIQDGAKASRFTKPAYGDMVRAQLGEPPMVTRRHPRRQPN